MTQIIETLDTIAARYEALYCDLWGCLHDGQKPYPEAVAALRRFRAGGSHVILLTNSPRPAAFVAAQLGAMDVPEDCYDAIVSSGDAAQAAMISGQFGTKVHHVGPARDIVFFQHPDGSPVKIERVAIEDADSIVCTGLFDDQTETPEDYRLLIAQGVNRGLRLLCANPDIVVDVGERRQFCAGAIAAAYTEAGGESFYFGKPHAAIYDLAQVRLEALRGRPADAEWILCIGDGIGTDIAGGINQGLDTVFVTGGLAASDTGTVSGHPDPLRLQAYLASAQLSPTAAMGHLR